MSETPNTTAALRVAVRGTLEYRDADGNVIGTATLSGTLPLQPSPTTPDADEAGADHGLDHD